MEIKPERLRYYTNLQIIEDSIERLNPEFSLCTILVAYHGDNRNMSSISKQVFDDNLWTIYGVPIIGEWIKLEEDQNKETWGSHGGRLIIDSEGIKYEQTTRPFGFVTEYAYKNASWINVLESDGYTEHEYLKLEKCILWNSRYEEANSILKENFGQSMEISNIEGFNRPDGYFEVSKFSYSALCILGTEVEPCFESAMIGGQYELSQLKTEFALMKSELQKLAFSFENNPNNQKGGNELLNEKLELLAKYNLTLEQIDFKIDDISIEDLETKLKDNYSVADPKPEKTVVEFSATYRQKRDALNNALDPVVVKDADGNITNETYYWVSDFDDIYVFVERYYWDAQNSESTYGRFSYTFDDTTISATITGEFEEMVVTWLTKEENQKIQDERAAYEVIKSEFETYKTSYVTPETEVEELRTFKANQIKTERDEAEKALFSQFDEKLNGVEEYETLKTNAGNFELDDLEEKCLALFARKSMNFSCKPKTNKTVKIPVTNANTNNDAPYGGIFEQYGKVGK